MNDVFSCLPSRIASSKFEIVNSLVFVLVSSLKKPHFFLEICDDVVERQVKRKFNKNGL